MHMRRTCAHQIGIRTQNSSSRSHVSQSLAHLEKALLSLLHPPALRQAVLVLAHLARDPPRHPLVHRPLRTRHLQLDRRRAGSGQTARPGLGHGVRCPAGRLLGHEMGLRDEGLVHLPLQQHLPVDNVIGHLQPHITTAHGLSECRMDSAVSQCTAGPTPT
jgi:hypothetical protein